MKTFAELLEMLCETLDRELERQETVLAVCESQQRAARIHDVEYLEARNVALNELVREAAEAETQRKNVMAQLRQYVDVPDDRELTLSDIVGAAPEPWRGRVAYFQSQLNKTIARTRSVVHENALLMRRSLEVVVNALQVVRQCMTSGESSVYTMQARNSAFQTAPALVDQRG